MQIRSACSASGGANSRVIDGNLVLPGVFLRILATGRLVPRNAGIQEFCYPASMSRYVPVQPRGTITIPAAIRRRLHLDEPGAQVEITEHEGTIILRPQLPIPADQAWFWTERWQQMEREADEDINAGRIRTADSTEEFLDKLDAGLGR